MNATQTATKSINNVLTPIEILLESQINEAKRIKEQLIPKHPILSKHQHAVNKAKDELLIKYSEGYIPDDFGWYSSRDYQIIKGCEKISEWRIGDVINYISQIKRKYAYSFSRANFHYSPKYDRYLFTICCAFLKIYYGEDKYEKIMLTA